ncbi:MAG: hypothetical protein ACLRZ9_01015 [Eubacterium sp.]
MVDYRKITNNFLTYYIENDYNNLSLILSENLTTNYSNLPNVNDKKSLLHGLKWEYSYDVKRVTTTNFMHYIDGKYAFVGLIAHHLVSFEKNNEMFPLTFGGKYVFKINCETAMIEDISFVLEYQAENTIYIKDKWVLSNGQNNYSSFCNFDSNKIYSESIKKCDFKTLTNLFFWCLDTQNLTLLDNLCSDSFFISRDKSVGSDNFTADKNNIEQFIHDTNKYYALNQNSIKINNIQYDSIITINAQRLTPHRLGTKKLNSLTKYHSFFDEDIVITINPSTLKFESIVMKKVADVFYNGITLLEY